MSFYERRRYLKPLQHTVLCIIVRQLVGPHLRSSLFDIKIIYQQVCEIETMIFRISE